MKHRHYPAFLRDWTDRDHTMGSAIPLILVFMASVLVGSMLTMWFPRSFGLYAFSAATSTYVFLVSHEHSRSNALKNWIGTLIVSLSMGWWWLPMITFTLLREHKPFGPHGE